MNTKIIVSLTTLTAFCLSSAALASELIVTNLNKPILLKKNTQKITFELPANPSTGYSWFLIKYNTHLVQTLSEQYKRSGKRLMGAGGVSLWKFKIEPQAFIVPQITKIVLYYVQPWQITQDLGKNVKKQIIILVTQ